MDKNVDITLVKALHFGTVHCAMLYTVNLGQYDSHFVLFPDIS